MGAAVQSIFLLIDCKAADQTTIPGRKNIPAIVTLFGQNSFDHPLTAPWDTLIGTRQDSSNIANGLLCHAWNH